MKTFLLRCLIGVGALLVMVGWFYFHNNHAQKTMTSKQEKVTRRDSKWDGEPISLVKINVPQTYDEIQSYQLTYWSGGVKTVAYVAVPKEEGIYPLHITLHGGYTLPTFAKHVKTITDNGETIKTAGASQIQNSELRMILLAPMYRGYDKSGGTVKGLKGDTLDTENAIKALETFFLTHKGYPTVEKGHLYVSGTSLGGGVALKLASERTDIIDVTAISPFVGWDIMGAWDQKHNINDFLNMKSDYGVFKPANPTYQAQSIDFKKIAAPVLLIQGTADSFNPWETVQIFYKEMKSDKKNVILKLIKGGYHGLTNKETVLSQTIQDFAETNWSG